MSSSSISSSSFISSRYVHPYAPDIIKNDASDELTSPLQKLEENREAPEDFSQLERNPLNRIKQTLIPLSGATEILNNLFEDQNVVWIHGKKGTDILLGTYCRENHGKYEDKIYQIDAGKNSNDLIKALKQQLGIDPEKHVYHFEEKHQQNPYLIIITGAKLRHCHILKWLIPDYQKTLQHYIILSEEQIHINSLKLDVDQNWRAQVVSGYKESSLDLIGKAFPEPLHFCLATQIIHTGLVPAKQIQLFSEQKKKSSPIKFFLDQLEKANPDLARTIKTLASLANSPFHRTFLNSLSKQSVKIYALLNDLGLILQMPGDFFVFQKEMAEEIKKELSKQEKIHSIQTLTPLLQGWFRSKGNEWIFPHIEETFRQNFKELDGEQFVQYGGTVLEIGHYYTQNGLPLSAQEITDDLRKKIKDYAAKHCKKSLPSHPQEAVKALQKIHRLLPHLYAYTFYQIGRSHFYQKREEQSLGSLAVLTYAKELIDCCPPLDNNPFFLSIQIERNGLLFHKIEASPEKKAIYQLKDNLIQEPAFREKIEKRDQDLTDVIKGYQALKNLKNPHTEIDFRSGISKKFQVDDPQHKVVCLNYIIKAKTEKKEAAFEEKKELETLLDHIPPHQQTTSKILIGYLLLNEEKPSKEELHKLTEMQHDSISIENKIELLKLLTQWQLRLKDKDKVQHYAKQYRQEAETYYGKGQRLIYDLYIYEKTPDASPIALHYLKLFDFSLLKAGYRLREYHLKEEQITIKTEKVAYIENFTYIDPQGHCILDLKCENFEKKTCELLERTLMQRAPQTREISLKEEKMPEGGIHLTRVEEQQEHTLKLSQRFVQFLQEKGEWEDIKKVMKAPIFDKQSRYFKKDGYRLEVETHKTNPPISSPIKQKEPEKTELCTWSDEEEDHARAIQDFEEKIESIKKTDPKKNTHPPSLPLVGEISSKKQKKLKEETQKKIGFKDIVRETSQKISEHTSAHNKKQYVEAYIASQGEKSKEISPFLQLEKAKKESEYLVQRQAYLKNKIEGLEERALLREMQAQVEEAQTGLLLEWFPKLKQLPIVQEAKPVNLSRPEDQQKDADQLHFKDPYTFIYHVLKHQLPHPFQQKEGALHFDMGQFEKNAHEFLNIARSIVKMQATLFCAIPDQYDDNTTNYRYIQFHFSQTLVEDILKLQEQIQEKEQQVAILKREEENNSYSTVSAHKKEITKIGTLITKINVEKKALENILEKLIIENENQECQFTTVASEKTPEGKYSTYFRTQFSKRYELGKLPNTQILSSINKV